MIGLIGPSDSVALTERIAAQMGLTSQLLPIVYKDPAEAPELAAKIGRLSSVTLFTGRYPYLVAQSHGIAMEQSTYIAHDGTELFRALAGLALSADYRGTIPPVSFDTVSAPEVAETYDELSLDRPYFIVPLELEQGLGFASPEQMAQNHLDLYLRGDVRHCLTTVDKVYRLLIENGAPATRLLHSGTSIRHALIRAKLMLDLGRAQRSQTVVCILRRLTPADGDSHRFSAFASVFAELVSGHIIAAESDEIVVLTLHGAIERQVEPRLVSASEGAEAASFSISVGTGENMQIAELNARKSADATETSMSFLPVGTEIARLAMLTHAKLKIERKRALAIAKSTDLYPHFIERILSVFKQLDPDNFTAAEFAKIYGVTPRSARRIVAMLKSRGLVSESGLAAHGTIGRPEHAFRISISKLSDLMSEVAVS